MRIMNIGRTERTWSLPRLLRLLFEVDDGASTAVGEGVTSTEDEDMRT